MGSFFMRFYCQSLLPCTIRPASSRSPHFVGEGLEWSERGRARLFATLLDHCTKESKKKKKKKNSLAVTV